MGTIFDNEAQRLSAEATQDKCHCFVRTTQWENIRNSQKHTENLWRIIYLSIQADNCWRSLSTHFIIQLGEVLVISSG